MINVIKCHIISSQAKDGDDEDWPSGLNRESFDKRESQRQMEEVGGGINYSVVVWTMTTKSVELLM